jgi:hypothetical protein
LSGHCSSKEKRFSVGADLDLAGIDPERNRPSAKPDAFEHDGHLRRSLQAARSGSCRLGRRRLRRNRPWLLVLEEIAELVLAELRRFRHQINPDEHGRLGPLRRVEQQIRSIGAPLDALNEAIRHEADGPCASARR